jgi:hypothetical protein
MVRESRLKRFAEHSAAKKSLQQDKRDMRVSFDAAAASLDCDLSEKCFNAPLER